MRKTFYLLTFRTLLIVGLIMNIFLLVGLTYASCERLKQKFTDIGRHLLLVFITFVPRKLNPRGTLTSTTKTDYHFLKWGAASRWSFRPNSAWVRIETTTIAKTHPTLLTKSKWTLTDLYFSIAECWYALHGVGSNFNRWWKTNWNRDFL